MNADDTKTPFNPFTGLFRSWFRISSIGAAIAVWLLDRSEELEEDSSSEFEEPLTRLSIAIGRFVYVLLALVCVLWTTLTVAESIRMIFDWNFSHSWLNFPWWIVLPMWLPVPFIYYFFIIGYDILLSAKKEVT